MTTTMNPLVELVALARLEEIVRGEHDVVLTEHVNRVLDEHGVDPSIRERGIERAYVLADELWAAAA